MIVDEDQRWRENENRRLISRTARRCARSTKRHHHTLQRRRDMRCKAQCAINAAARYARWLVDIVHTPDERRLDTCRVLWEGGCPQKTWFSGNTVIAITMIIRYKPSVSLEVEIHWFRSWAISRMIGAVLLSEGPSVVTGLYLRANGLIMQVHQGGIATTIVSAQLPTGIRVPTLLLSS